MPCGPKNCCSPIVIKTTSQRGPPQCVSVQVPSQTVQCVVPPARRSPKTTCCNIPVILCDTEERCPKPRGGGGCSAKPCPAPCCPAPCCGPCGPAPCCGPCGPAPCCGPCGPPPCCIPGCPPSCCKPACCMPPMNFSSANNKNKDNNNGCPPKVRREKRWPMCNFMKPCIDTRIYRDGEAMTISYAGHIPGEQYISGRNLPTTTTFAKRRLCQYTPYEFVDPDGCCSFP